MASDAAFYEVLENDLRALSAEARKTDSLATQITGWLQHTDYPQIKESAERAVLKLRAVAHEGRGVEAVRTPEILRPFLLVCESKNPRLIGIVLGSVQKLLAHNAVSDEGRTQIIQALQQVEKSSDDTVKLKILQTALTHLQNPRNVDDKDGAGQVLSICFRLYCQNRGSPKVVSTAAATIRQAVALLFDHTVLDQQPLSPGHPPVPEGLASGREMAAMLLLQDLMNMCAGHTPTWLKCPMVGRAFVLDLLEFVLLHRPAAFQTHSSFKVLLQSKLAPCIAGLSQTALDPEVEPAATGEAKLLLRCLGALLRKHALLLPDMSLTLIELLLAGCSTTRMPWQRLLSLQVLRSLMADHQLLYVLFTSYDMSIHHDMNAVHDTLSVAVEALKGYMKAAEGSEEDMVGALSSIYSSRAVGKEVQMDIDTHGPAQASMQEVWTAYLAIEVLLAVVASVEVLADAVGTSSTTAPSDPLLLAPLATAGSDNAHSALSSSNSLAGLVRGSSSAHGTGTGTPRVSSVNALFALNNPHRGGSATASPRGSMTSLYAVAGGEDGSSSKAAAAAGGNSGSSAVLPAQPALGTLPAAASKPARAQSMALSAPVVAAQHPGVAPLNAATVSTVVDVLWRPVVAGLSCALGHCRSRSGHESLMLVLLRGFQSYIFSAGALGEVPARDDFLKNLWPIFLTHLMEVLHSGNSVIGAAGLEALDRTLTGAIAAPDLGQASAQPQQQQQQPALSSFASFGSGSGQSTEGHAADVEHMLLVALEGMYKEEREPDVRQGLLRVALHVLQRHGEALSRGWVPLLRLLEAVPSWEDGATISASYQCVESVCSDFLPTMPKIYIPKALEVVQLFAAQKAAINISLSAVGLLWNATDLLGRSRAAAGAAAAAAATAAAAAAAAAEAPEQQQPLQHSGSSVSSALGGIFSVLSLSRRPTVEDPAIKAAAATTGGSPAKQGTAAAAAGSPSSSATTARAGSPLGGKSSGGPDADARTDSPAAAAAAGAAADPHLAGRSDLTEDECTELLIRVFEHLRAIGMDPRPEVRNSGMRTLFLAVGSQAGRFSAATWRHCLWEILFPLIQYAHFMGDMSSSEEAAAVELGKEKGRAVMMLVHHSRNTEQKQWDETTVVAFNGLGKVMRAHMPTVLALPGINEKWDEVCKIASQALMSGRKSVAVSAAQLVTGFLQGFKPPAASQTSAGSPAGPAAAGNAGASGAAGAAAAAAAANYTWKRTLTAIDEGVTVMAMPNTRVPLQARSELLSGLSVAYTAQASEGVFDVADMQLLLRWLDMLARNPKGTDDVKAVAGVLPPVQKLVLQLLGQLNMALLPDAWPDMLRTLSGFMCPFRAMMQQRQQEAMAAAAAAVAAASGAAAAGGCGSGADAAALRTPRAAGAAVPSTPQTAGSLGGARSFNRLFSARPGGPVPAAATDAAQLTTQWICKVAKRLVELYAHAPWQVRAGLFGPVVHGLSECAALRYVCPDDPLWQQAASGLTGVIQAGLPAVNIMFVNSSQQPAQAWQVLADAFETFLLGEGLPEGLLPSSAEQQQQQRAGNGAGGQPQLRHSGGGPVAATAVTAADGAAESALQTSVLDVLTEQVLASCSSAAYEQRSRLVRVLVVGAGSTAGHACLASGSTADADATSVHAAAAAAAAAGGGGTGDSSCRCPAADQRFSQMCLRRLAMLASRGTDGQAGSLNAVLLEVAQIALPQLLQRCRVVLQAYCRVEQAAVASELQQLQRQVQAQQQGQGSQHQGEGDAVAGQVVPLVCQAECTVVAIVQQVQQQQDQAGEAGSGEQAQMLQLQQRCLVEEVLCVLHVLLELRIDVAVFEHLLGQEPSLAACLAAVQHAQVVHAQLQQQQQQSPGPQQAGAGLLQQQLSGSSGAQQQRQQSAAAAEVQRRYSSTSQGGASEQGDGDSGGGSSSTRHQGHLLLLYRELADCAGCRDRRVGVLVRAALQAAGQQLAL